MLVEKYDGLEEFLEQNKSVFEKDELGHVTVSSFSKLIEMVSHKFELYGPISAVLVRKWYLKSNNFVLESV